MLICLILSVSIYYRPFSSDSTKTLGEKGTLRYFREKLNHRNVTLDVKHFEDCEQLFLSVGRCYVTEAFLEFFQMDDPKQKPNLNAPNMAFTITPDQKKTYMINVLDKFLDQYIFIGDNKENPPFGDDGVCHNGINLIKSFIILMILKMLLPQEMADICQHCTSNCCFISSQLLVLTVMLLRCWYPSCKRKSYCHQLKNTNVHGQQQ